MLIPTIPPYIKSLGASSFQIGLVTAMFSIGAIIIRPLIGYLLEFSKRRYLVLIGALALLVMTIMYPLSNIIFVLLLIRLLHGSMWGWSTTANGTAAVDIVPDSRLGEGMGYFGLSITIGMIMAPSLGIYLYQHASFQMMIIVSAILGTIAFILLSLIQYNTPEAVLNVNRSKVKFKLFDSLIEKSSWYPAIVTLMATFGYGSIVTFIVIFGEERRIEQIFLFYLVNALIATVVRPITGRWFDRKGPKGLVILCALLSFLAMWVLSYSHSWIGIVMAGVLFGAGYGSLIPTLQAWVLSKTSSERRGVANGMFYSAIDLGIGISGLIFGLVAQYVSIASIFQISSFFFLVVIIFTLNAGERTFRMIGKKVEA